MKGARLGAGLALLVLGTGCSFVDPHEGGPQAACGLDAGGTGVSQNGQATGYNPMANKATSPTCAANTGSACDDCESTHCCASRVACYGDPVCACADLALDQCLEASQASPAAEQASEVSGCWDAFSGKGAVEQARVACQRSWCPVACAVP